MFEPAIDRLGGSVAGSGPVEVSQHVDGPLGERAAQGDQLGQRLRHSMAERVDDLDHQLAASDPVGLPVGGDHALVDAPGSFDLDVRVVGEQRLEPLLLFVGEQVGASVEGAAGPVERIVGAATVAVDDLLDPAATPVEGVAGEPDDGKGSSTATASGSSSTVAVLNPVNPSIATTSIWSRQAGGRSASHR